MGATKGRPRSSIEDVKERNEARWMAINGVTGVGIGEYKDQPCIVIYVEGRTPELRKTIPTEIEGYKVITEVTGEIIAFETGETTES